jgi:hypothetical protein
MLVVVENDVDVNSSFFQRGNIIIESSFAHTIGVNIGHTADKKNRTQQQNIFFNMVQNPSLIVWCTLCT